MANYALRVLEAREKVIALEPRISGEDRLHAVPRGEHGKHVFDSQAPAADDRLATENLRVTGDSIEQVRVRHRT